MPVHEWLTLFAVPSLLFLFYQMIITIISKRHERNKIEDQSERTGIQALLMIQLEDKHDFYIERGWASFREKNIYDKLYKSYHNLGENGVMDAAYREVMNLPTQQEEANNNN